MTFQEKFDAIVNKNNSLLCIGLDPDLEKLPDLVKNDIFAFNKAIIDATHDLVCVCKPNIAFYEAEGIEGLKALKKTIKYIQKAYPDVPVLLDAKRGDIGNTAAMYAKSAFEYWNADAITVYPHLGRDSILPFLEYKDKLTILLVKTSNPDSGMLQDLPIYSSSDPELAEGESRSTSSRQARTIPYYLAMAKKIKGWNYENIGIFVGATYPDEMKKVRELFPDRIFLSAGLGAQKAEIEQIVRAGVDKSGKGIMFNASRSVLYASSGDDFAEKAREQALATRDIINTYRT